MCIWIHLFIFAPSLIGNNDLYINYVPPVSSDNTSYMDLRQIIEPYLFFKSSNTSSTIEEFRGTFDVGGFYRFTLTGKDLILVKVVIRKVVWWNPNLGLLWNFMNQLFTGVIWKNGSKIFLQKSQKRTFNGPNWHVLVKNQH